MAGRLPDEVRTNYHSSEEVSRTTLPQLWQKGSFKPGRLHKLFATHASKQSWIGPTANATARATAQACALLSLERNPLQVLELTALRSDFTKLRPNSKTKMKILFFMAEHFL